MTTKTPATPAKPELTEEEARAREIVKAMLPHYWKLFNEFYSTGTSWEELKDAGEWGAALASMGEAIWNFCWQADGEMAEAERLFNADRMEEKRLAARRRACREAAKAANG